MKATIIEIQYENYNENVSINNNDDYDTFLSIIKNDADYVSYSIIQKGDYEILDINKLKAFTYLSFNGYIFKKLKSTKMSGFGSKWEFCYEISLRKQKWQMVGTLEYLYPFFTKLNNITKKGEYLIDDLHAVGYIDVLDSFEMKTFAEYNGLLIGNERFKTIQERIEFIYNAVVEAGEDAIRKYFNTVTDIVVGVAHSHNVDYDIRIDKYKKEVDAIIEKLGDNTQYREMYEEIKKFKRRELEDQSYYGD